ncbi:S8 family peptidase [Ekhidna sp.]|uniref:S8 family peptidase n=1 Tax=Ekhidna sp. TaxID=2608089 RepID=UPI00351416DB
MRGVVLSMLLFVWCSVLFAQKPDSWSTIKKNEVTSQVEPNTYYLIEGDLALIRKENPDLEVWRILDKDHHIVSGILDSPSNHAWTADDRWKLNLARDESNLFKIVTRPGTNLNLPDELRVIRTFPDRNTIIVEGDRSKVIDALLPKPEVVHITNRALTPSVESRVIDLNLNPNRVNKVHHFFPVLNGSTETVSIQENRFNEDDIDLLNRTVASGLESETIDNHATEMATVIAGRGNSFVTGRGVAQSAKITSSSFDDVMPDSDASYTDLSILTQNHSYGITDDTSHYGVEARAFDLSAVNNPNLLHVFSSGNGGAGVANGGNYHGITGYANLTGNIKMSKNSLVVGSVDTLGNVPGFVSRGPTYDGRIKPEVVSYSVVGSSNSAALTSGVATLLQQQYRIDNSSDMPSALVKALLINSAEDVGAAGPDFFTGFGNLNAWRSLQALQGMQYFNGLVTNGNTTSFILAGIPADAVNLKVTLVWTDPPANVDDFEALVNDLDLRLVSGGATTTLPWVLDTNPDADDLSKPATRGVDNLNNVEQVTIANPETSYTIEVEGSMVTGSQDFYLAWQYDIADSFEWDFPTGSDNMPYNGETGSYFRWSTAKSGIGELAYTIDDTNWIVLDSEVDVERGYWRWNSPPSIGDEVRARMQIGGEFFETDLFTVSEPLKARVGFNCGDSLMLRWHPAINADDYTVFNLGEEQLEEITTVMDTFLVIDNISSLADRRFSIRPNLSGGKSLLPTPTFDYSLQGVGCYLFSFFQTIALDTGIYLNLSLGTIAGIDEIILERNNLYEYVEIARLSELSETISYLDKSPNQGYNEHRATIRFINGEELTLSAGTSFYLTEIPVRVFPNPAQSGEFISIITRQFEERTPVLELIDHNGALIHSQLVQGTQDVIGTEALRSGIYIYRLKADGVIYTGRILIR